MSLVEVRTLQGVVYVSAVVLDAAGHVHTIWEGNEPYSLDLDLNAIPEGQSPFNACRLTPEGLDPDNDTAHLSLRLCDADGDCGGTDLAWIRKGEDLSFSYFGWPRRPALVRVGENGNLARLEPEGWYNAEREAYGSLVIGDAAYLDAQLRDWRSGRLIPDALTPLGPRQRLSALAV